MNKSKQRGTAWETAVVNYLRDRGWVNAERRALGGRHDRGDIAGVVGVVIECKATARIDLAGWLDEATTERDNDRADIAAAWFKRRGRAHPESGYVLMDGETFTTLLAQAGYGSEEVAV